LTAEIEGCWQIKWNIKDGLPAEIAARRKQYEHYRNQLLTFKPLD